MTICLDLRYDHHGVRLDFSRPGTPTDNGPVETFKGSLHDERLDVYWFDSLGQARTLSSYGARTTMRPGLICPRPPADLATTAIPKAGFPDLDA